MAALTDLSDAVNRLTGGNSGTPENPFFFKSYTIAGVADTWAAGLWYSCWKYDGFPGPGANPTTVAAPTKSTDGSLQGITNAGGGREKQLLAAQIVTSQPGDVSCILLYDRLLHIGGLDGTVTTAQTVGGSLTRNTGGVGNKIFVEIYTAVGSTARTITASYTDQGGNSGTTQAVTFGGTAGTVGNDANLFLELPLAAGDYGVQGVTSVTIGTGSTGTAGNFGVTVARPIAYLFTNNRGQIERDFTRGPGGPRVIESDACLAFAVLAGSTGEAAWNGMLSTVEK